jgi:hypothetical protein
MVSSTHYQPLAADGYEDTRQMYPRYPPWCRRITCYKPGIATDVDVDVHDSSNDSMMVAFKSHQILTESEERLGLRFHDSGFYCKSPQKGVLPCDNEWK